MTEWITVKIPRPKGDIQKNIWHERKVRDWVDARNITDYRFAFERSDWEQYLYIEFLNSKDAVLFGLSWN